MRSVDVADAEAPLSFHNALVSPCASCQATPCCQYLPLWTFALETVIDVDYARYLLNFENIELGVASDGTWSVYYRQSCRFLAPDTLGCRLHGTPDKPHVCVQYNPFSCFYRRALSPGGMDGYLRIDRHRMGVIAESLAFDTDRRIIAAPTIESLAEVFVDYPVDDEVVPYRPGPNHPNELAATRPGDLTDPCGSCQAYCCTTLLFPISPPVSISSLDYLRFVLGFPGTELVVLNTEWQLAVNTRCRHLDGNRCGIFGEPERPLRCQFYDAWTCGHRAVFAGQGSASSVRVRLAEFPALAGACAFNPDGTAAMVPTAEQLRSTVGECTLSDDAQPHRRSLPLFVVSHPAGQEP
jgi:hypothetical protein